MIPIPEARTRRPSVLVLDRDHVVAADIAGALQELDLRVAGPVHSAEEALRLCLGGAVDAAIVELVPGDDAYLELARQLRQAGTPTLLTTGSERRSLPCEFREEKLWIKPFAASQLARACASAGRTRVS